MHHKPFNVIYLAQVFQLVQYSSQINQYFIHCNDMAFDKQRKQDFCVLAITPEQCKTPFIVKAWSKNCVLVLTQYSFWTTKVWIHSNLWNIHWTIASLSTLQVCIPTPDFMYWRLTYWLELFGNSYFKLLCSKEVQRTYHVGKKSPHNLFHGSPPVKGWFPIKFYRLYHMVWHCSIPCPWYNIIPSHSHTIPWSYHTTIIPYHHHTIPLSYHTMVIPYHSYTILSLYHTMVIPLFK